MLKKIVISLSMLAVLLVSMNSLPAAGPKKVVALTGGWGPRMNETAENALVEFLKPIELKIQQTFSKSDNVVLYCVSPATHAWSNQPEIERQFPALKNHSGPTALVIMIYGHNWTSSEEYEKSVKDHYGKIFSEIFYLTYEKSSGVDGRKAEAVRFKAWLKSVL